MKEILSIYPPLKQSFLYFFTKFFWCADMNCQCVLGTKFIHKRLYFWSFSYRSIITVHRDTARKNRFRESGLYNKYFQHISSSIVDHWVHPRNLLLPPWIELLPPHSCMYKIINVHVIKSVYTNCLKLRSEDLCHVAIVYEREWN